MTFIFSNNCNTTLAAPITTTGQTTITLSSAANLPTITAGQTFALTLNDAATQAVFEIVYVTARTGAVLTVLRGQEGTAAQTWLVGDYAYGAATAGILASFAAASAPGTTALDTGIETQTKTGLLILAAGVSPAWNANSPASLFTAFGTSPGVAWNASGGAGEVSIYSGDALGRTVGWYYNNGTTAVLSGYVTNAGQGVFLAGVAAGGPLTATTGAFSSDVGIAGNLDVEGTANVDGLLTGVNATFSGNVTAVEFLGSGAGLTSIPTSAIAPGSPAFVFPSAGTTSGRGPSNATVTLPNDGRAYTIVVDWSAYCVGDSLFIGTPSGGGTAGFQTVQGSGFNSGTLRSLAYCTVAAAAGQTLTFTLTGSGGTSTAAGVWLITAYH